MRTRALLNTLIVASGYLLSRLLGLGREIIISNQFGTSPQLDAYRAAFGLVDLIYLVIAGGALGSAFIPVFSGFLAERRETDAWRLASSMLNLALIALLAGCGLLALLAGPLVSLTIGSGFDPAKQELTVQIVRLLLIQPVLLGLGGLAKAALESFDQFTLPAVGSNLYNIGIIAGALLAPWLGIHGLTWGVIAGAALFLLVQLPGLRAVGAMYLRRPPEIPTLSIPGVARVLRLLGPRVFGQSAWQINMVAIASFASTLGNGPVAANGYALQLMMLPHGLIALSLGTVMFPRLARHYASGDTIALRTDTLSYVRGVLFLALPATALLATLATPVVRALYERGRFDTASTALTAEALTFYALGLAGFAVAEIAVRVFFAMQDTRTPVYVGIAAVALNIALGWSFLRLGMGLGGLGLAFSIANTFEAAILLALLIRRIGATGQLWRGLASMIIATLGSGVAIYTLLWFSSPLLPFLQTGAYRWPADFLPLIGWLAGVTLVGAAAYSGIAALLRIDELLAIRERVLYSVMSRFFKKT